MKKIFLTLTLCSFVGAMFAQGVKYGVTAGLNVSSINISEAEDIDLGYKPGFQAGVVVDWGITQNLSIIPELNFSQKGTKISQQGDEGKLNWNLTLNYLTLPVNLAYKFDLGLDQKLLVFAGPYLGYGLSTSHKIKVKVDGATVNVDTDKYLKEVYGDKNALKFGSKDNQFKRFDFGANVGVGYQYSNILFKLQYNLGLVNIVPDKDENWKNSNFGVTVGYMF
ncbi:MAG: PorT family protein [Candidatus Symbiothrix sp.]|jgi:hypothetical protein|nr:PorT family protein [Candidatus Symbiothrix sp.]